MDFCSFYSILFFATVFLVSSEKNETKKIKKNKQKNFFNFILVAFCLW